MVHGAVAHDLLELRMRTQPNLNFKRQEYEAMEALLRRFGTVREGWWRKHVCEVHVRNRAKSMHGTPAHSASLAPLLSAVAGAAEDAAEDRPGGGQGLPGEARGHPGAARCPAAACK